MPNRSQKSEQKSRSKCDLCKGRDADGLLGKICHVCQNKIQYEHLPPDEKERLISSLVPKRYVKAKMVHLPEKIQAAFKEEIDTGVLLWGASGVGKTYAMCALAKKYIAEGFTIERTHYETLCLRLRDTYNRNATQTEWGIIEPLLECDKLFIEDVATTKTIGKLETDFSLRTFLVLLDMRMEHCRPTFITTNKSVENLASSFDERIGDRLRVFKVFKLSGKSKRRAL